jgi:polysaccharide export outer membrane protein
MAKLNGSITCLVVLAMLTGDAVLLAAGSQATQQKPPAAKGAPVPQAPPAAPVAPPADYVIGAGDVLIVVFRREKDMSSEVTVRPDGKITLPLLNDIQATGLSPDQLRASVTEEAKRLVEDPSVTIIVKEINSRKVFITGQVGKPGAYPIVTRMTVMQLIAMAGGLSEFAKQKEIVIIRDAPVAAARAGAKPQTFRFNYQDVQRLKNLASNIDLKSGDMVIVP